MSYEILAFVAIAVLAVMGGFGFAKKILPWMPAWLVLAAIGLRLFGSTARYEVNFRFYGGAGDAIRYYAAGLDMLELGLTSTFSPDFWMSGSPWWGTSFVDKLSSVILQVIGPTMRGEFAVFSIFALVGLAMNVVAFHRVSGERNALRYATWLLLVPSLWFWPSSVGKEAVLTLAVGLATAGYVGKDDRVNWPLFLGGIALASCIRPHVAAALALASVVAVWFASWQKVTGRRIGQIIVGTAVALVALQQMASNFSLADADFAGIEEFMLSHGDATLQGGSAISGVALADGGPLLALVNVWMRPFIWEAHNPMAMAAALELSALWLTVFIRRKEVFLALLHWREHRVLLFALPFALGYSLMIGLTFGNLGIISRQRVLAMPCMLMLLLVVPTEAERKEGEPRPTKPVVPPPPTSRGGRRLRRRRQRPQNAA